MANLEFCDKHNMVAYLKKPTGSEGFQEIVDCLNGSHIRYALTKNPTIYVSLIKKFWQTATVRTVDNGEQEITAIVDGKEFTITKASVRRHLQLADVDGGSPRCQKAIGGSIAQTRSERVPTQSYDSPLSRVHTLGSDEGSTTELEKTVKSNQARRRAKIVVLDDEEDLEDSSKQGRMIEEIDQDAGVTLVTPTHSQEDQPEDYIASRLFSTAEESVSTAGVSMPVSTAGMVQEVNISIPSPVVIKDKGKGKIEKYKDEQIKRTKLQQEQDRLGHEATEEWENIRARVEADEELSKRLQAEERNKYSEVDQAKMLVGLINQRKKYFVAQKAEAKRNKPMPQAQ
ncbi:hypothetical protein Tco_1482323 [Tanacetum coccineum]